jgi:hypothetical protein
LPPNRLQNEELSVLENFQVGLGGDIERRSGFNKLHDGTTLAHAEVRLLGFFSITSKQVFLGYDGTNLCESTDGAAWTVLGAYSGIRYGIQYADKFYIVRSGSTILSYDGTAVTALSGSPTGTFCYIFKDRLFVLNTESSSVPSRLYFSSPGDPATWPGTNFIDVQAGDGDVLTVCFPYQDRLLVFKGRTTHVLYVQSDPSNWVLRIANTENGCLSCYGVQDVIGLLWIATARGIYKTDGITFEEVSKPIRNVFVGRSAELTALNKDHAGRWGDLLIWRLRLTSGDYVYYSFNAQNNSWSQLVIAGELTPAYFVEMLTQTPAPGLYSGDVGALGRVLRYGDSIYKDGGSSYTSRLVSKEFDMDVPVNYKRGKWSLFELMGEGTVKIKYRVDGVDEDEYEEVETTDQFKSQKVHGPGYFRSCAVILENTDADSLNVFGWTMMTHKKREVIETGV